MNISLIESVYNFDPGLKITPRGLMQDLIPWPCVVSSDLVVFTDLHGFEGLFKNLCFSFITDFYCFAEYQVVLKIRRLGTKCVHNYGKLAYVSLRWSRNSFHHIFFRLCFLKSYSQIFSFTFPCLSFIILCFFLSGRKVAFFYTV